MSFLLAILLTAMQAAAPAPSPVEQTFLQGETLDFNLTWLKITGGTARMTIAPVEEASRFRITSVARSSASFSRIFKVRDEIETTVAREDFSTLRYVKRLDEEGDKHEEVTVVENGIATRTRRKVKKVQVPRPVLDPISVIYHLRKLDLTPGRAYDLELIADGKLYSVHAKVVRRERITTPAGAFSCVRVEPEMTSAGVARDERLFIWYSDDERKLPVRIRTEVKVGAITATLRRVASGAGSPEPPALTESKSK